MKGPAKSLASPPNHRSCPCPQIATLSGSVSALKRLVESHLREKEQAAELLKGYVTTITREVRPPPRLKVSDLFLIQYFVLSRFPKSKVRIPSQSNISFSVSLRCPVPCVGMLKISVRLAKGKSSTSILCISIHPFPNPRTRGRGGGSGRHFFSRR